MTRLEKVLAELTELVEQQQDRQSHRAVTPACGDVCICNNTCGCADDAKENT
ncbi:hypothetical protein [Pseudoalteromonas umbrosa]|uniref:hypothetical protein n=1 Tax=Pseudoalteromonas umbrosa TaxID=3048489 RepID=UPI0024C2826D|nr:hypothetical protein [Pseudoalteromonas sp. B95]MDK1290176.1 hypothetical protein [Pseudoalteromonas sp. B95]